MTHFIPLDRLIGLEIRYAMIKVGKSIAFLIGVGFIVAQVNNHDPLFYVSHHC